VLSLASAVQQPGFDQALPCLTGETFFEAVP
jgi:hypothetical protein